MYCTTMTLMQDFKMGKLDMICCFFDQENLQSNIA